MTIRVWFADVQYEADGTKDRVWFADEAALLDFVQRTCKPGVTVTKGWEWREERGR